MIGREIAEHKLELKQGMTLKRKQDRSEKDFGTLAFCLLQVGFFIIFGLKNDK